MSECIDLSVETTNTVALAEALAKTPVYDDEDHIFWQEVQIGLEDGVSRVTAEHWGYADINDVEPNLTKLADQFGVTFKLVFTDEDDDTSTEYIGAEGPIFEFDDAVGELRIAFECYGYKWRAVKGTALEAKAREILDSQGLPADLFDQLSQEP